MWRLVHCSLGLVWLHSSCNGRYCSGQSTAWTWSSKHCIVLVWGHVNVSIVTGGETRWLRRPGLPYPPSSSSFSSSFYLFISYSSFFSRHKLDSLFCSTFCSRLPFNSTSIQNLHVSAKHRAWGEELYYSPECIKALDAKLPSPSKILIKNIIIKWIY